MTDADQRDAPPTLAVVSSDAGRRSDLVGAVAAAGCGGVHCPDPETWDPRATVGPRVTVVDYDELSGPIRARIAAEIRRSSHGSYVLCSAGHHDLAELCARGVVSNIVACPDAVDAEDLVTTIEKLTHGNIFGLEHYCRIGGAAGEAVIGDSEHRSRVFDTLEAFADEEGVPPRFARLFVSLADELLTNALFNAPVDRDGQRAFATHSRRDQVRLRPRTAARVRWTFDGRRLGLSVTDGFGSLRPYEVCASLARHFRRGPQQARRGPGGARLGLLQAFASVQCFVCNIDPGVKTEVIGTLDVDRPYRHFARRPKSFHVFEAGDRRPVAGHAKAQNHR